LTVWFPNLVKARIKLGYTQKQMAKFLGYSDSRYANWEVGIRQPRLLEAIRIAQLLGDTVEHLFVAEQKPDTDMREKEFLDESEETA
jgi:DNA-binding XRE family transcriptional regulator